MRTVRIQITTWVGIVAEIEEVLEVVTVGAGTEQEGLIHRASMGTIERRGVEAGMISMSQARGTLILHSDRAGDFGY